jgi:UDP-4-amino-4,6-dideoxy-N-acetyl-beta-L-altrosamine transaminase
MINYGKQFISDDDIKAVVEVLRSDFLTQGPKITEFESEVAKKVGASEAIAVNSATSALHIACLSLGLGEGDVLWTTPNSFVSSSNCALFCGASVDFVDIDPDTFNISTQKLEQKLKQAALHGKLPKILVPVHIGGHSCDMAKIKDLANEYGFSVIEDASHAVGGMYKRAYIGSCIYSNITVFSFHPVKIITTGEGGMALTNDSKLAKKMRLLRSHGITRDPEDFDLPLTDIGPWYYQQSELGFNYRISDINCALGSSQISRLSKKIKRKREIAQLYNEKIKNDFLQLPVEKQNVYHSYHLYPLLIDFKKLKISKDSFIQEMSKKDITLQVHYKPIHLQNYYKNKYGFKKNDFKIAENFYSKEVSLPIYYGLKTKDQIKVIKTMDSILKKIRI